jgi:hypothetical protein
MNIIQKGFSQGIQAKNQITNRDYVLASFGHDPGGGQAEQIAPILVSLAWFFIFI